MDTNLREKANVKLATWGTAGNIYRGNRVMCRRVGEGLKWLNTAESM